MTRTEAAVERETILVGYYGPKAKAALIAHPEATMEVEPEPVASWKAAWRSR